MDSSTPTNEFKDVRDAVWAIRGIGLCAKAVALRLVEHWPRIFPKVKTIAEHCEISERAVRKALRKLESENVIRTTHRIGFTSQYEFVGVVIPRLGRRGAARGAPRNVVQESPAPRHQVQTPPARRAGPPGTRCRTPLHVVPPKERSKKKLKEREKKTRARDGAPARKARAPRPAVDLISITKWDGWTLSGELRAELVACGVPAEGARVGVDARIRYLTNRPLPRGGVLDLDDYVREFVDQWAEWGAEDKRNAPRGAGTEVSRRDPGSSTPVYGGAGGGPYSGWRAGAPAIEFCRKHGLNCSLLENAFHRTGTPKRVPPHESDKLFRAYVLEKLKEKKELTKVSERPSERAPRKKAA